MATDQQVPQKVTTAIGQYLKSVEEEVKKIVDAEGPPVEIPHFSQLEEAANKLGDFPNPAKAVLCISSLLGRASCVDMDVPTKPLVFPKDHAMHQRMGPEWYYVAANLQVEDNTGRLGRVSVFISAMRTRVMGNCVQEGNDLEDKDANVGTTYATVTVDMGDTLRKLYRRAQNIQWSPIGGTATYSEPNKEFNVTIGPDSLKGTKDVLPMDVRINDKGSGMQISIRLKHNGGVVDVEKAFFLQGAPKSSGSGSKSSGSGSLTKPDPFPEGAGSGISPDPLPGLYYSWPQVIVEAGGTIQVRRDTGDTYKVTVTSGDAWIDHQVMMQSLKDAKGEPKPKPSVGDLKYNGWIWQYFNTNYHNHAWTCAGFIVGDLITTKVPVLFGYYVQPDGRGWKSDYLTGEITMEDEQQYPVDVHHAGRTKVTFYKKRTYTLVNSDETIKFKALATPWIDDGTFNSPIGGIVDESPADLKLTQDTAHARACVGDLILVLGSGYLESVGFEPVKQSTMRLLQYLRSGGADAFGSCCACGVFSGNPASFQLSTVQSLARAIFSLRG